MAELYADASDFTRLSKALGRLPNEIRQKAFRRTMARLERRAKTEVVREAAKFSSAPQKHIRPSLRGRVGSDGLTLSLKTPWLSFQKLGMRQGAKGVSVRRRGQVRGSFVATMANGHTNAFIRAGMRSTPIIGLYGPNPAHAIINNPDRFEKIMAKIGKVEGADRLLHEIDRLLPR